jgi:hypothetical protein
MVSPVEVATRGRLAHPLFPADITTTEGAPLSALFGGREFPLPKFVLFAYGEICLRGLEEFLSRERNSPQQRFPAFRLRSGQALRKPCRPGQPHGRGVGMKKGGHLAIPLRNRSGILPSNPI